MITSALRSRRFHDPLEPTRVRAFGRGRGHHPPGRAGGADRERRPHHDGWPALAGSLRRRGRVADDEGSGWSVRRRGAAARGLARDAVLVRGVSEPMTSAGDRPRLAMLNQLLADTTPFVDSVRHDSFTYAAALEHVRAARPRVLYVSFGETDDWAHLGRYDNYLYSAQRFDRFTRQLWDEMQGLGQYHGRTTFVITVDHGRGSGPTEWKSHGEKIPESDKIWIGVMGPDTPALRERAETATVTPSQVAATAPP